MKLAIFGGTFDPIHYGHLEMARRAAEQFGLTRVLLVPASQPPHKAGFTCAPYEDRVRMAEIACRGEQAIEVSRLEEVTEFSYSINTIEKVRAGLAPDDELYFLIGADAFSEIRTWHRWSEVTKAVRFIVVSRPGCTYDVPAGTRVDRLDDLSLSVSSSAIRRALGRGEEPEEVPAAVLQYIRDHHLYDAGAAG